MRREQVINWDPDILGGTPVFAGTRVPVQTLIDYLKAGDSLDDFLEGFPSVSREQAQAFLELALDSALAEEFEDVLRFWFPQQLSDDHAAMIRQFEWWFRGGANSAIAERFPLLLERATRGELDHWLHRPRPRLALIIVLDQFSRSLYRGTARAFAQDQRALALALQGIEIGHYAALTTPWEKTFFFLPLGHSEELTHLEIAVKLAEELVEQAPVELRRVLEHSAAQARGHRDVIARFGRHPHRNAVLGRQSTPEELDYLASGQLVHTRPLPH